MPCFTVQPNEFVEKKSFFAANMENDEWRFPNISFIGFFKKHFLKVNEPRRGDPTLSENKKNSCQKFC